MIRFVACLGVLLIGMFSPLGLFLVAALIYAISFSSIEVIIIAGFIDAYYGSISGFMPVSTMSVLAIVVIVEWMRPAISLYNK